jgi:hypothetical protein
MSTTDELMVSNNVCHFVEVILPKVIDYIPEQKPWPNDLTV